MQAATTQVNDADRAAPGDSVHPAVPAGSSRLGLHLAMRPVFARNLDLIAFDPIFQTLDGAPVRADDYTALSLTLSESYTSVISDHGERIVPCFLRISSAVLEKLQLPDFPSDRFILEVSASADDRARDLQRYRSLAEAGYRIAVATDSPDQEILAPYLDFADVLKVDAGRLSLDAVASVIQPAVQQGLELMATDIASKDDFVALIDCGFVGFAGDVLGKPAASEGRRIDHNQALLLELLNELRKPDTNATTIERIVVKDPNLTFKILRIVNSAATGLPREVTSVSHAVTILGMAQLERWVSVLMLAENEGKPPELVRTSLVRARMCETIAEVLGRGEPMAYFLTGLLSNLDVIAEIPMAEIVNQVPLRDHVKQALVHREGELGEILSLVENYEKGRFPRGFETLPASFFEPCYRHSVAWANQIQASTA
jgi:EAL and modified HD-GYP domain-containing signal transduction protein